MTVSNGDTVQVEYTGRLEDGEVFDTSQGRGPLEFEVGSGQVIPGFDEAVTGMEVGDKTTVTIPPGEGYGERDERLMQKMEKERLGGTDVEVGQVLGLQSEDGRQFQATVHEVDETHVTLDFNHFLAGKTLVFDIEVTGIQG